MANSFETEVAKSYRSQTLTSPVQGLCCPNEYIKLVVNKQASYGVKTQCDALVDRLNNVGLALELKEQQKREAFKFSRVPDHQIEGLQRFKALGRNSYLLLCFRHWALPEKELAGLKPLEKRAAQRRRAYCLDIDLFLTLKAKAVNESKASIPIEWITTHAIRVPDSKCVYLTASGNKAVAMCWDISVIL